jgi:ABC-type transporter Mla subunit MlaD
MTRLELIRLIGDVIIAVDVLRSDFARHTRERTRLDDLRDDLDGFQRKLVRNVIDDNTSDFKALTASLNEVNTELRQTTNEVSKIAETLQSLVKFVGVVQKIIELIP